MSEEWKPRHNPWLIAVSVMSGTVLEVLDTSIANVALPHIAGSVGASNEEATWVVTSYLVANAIVLPLTGSLGSLFGRKRFLLGCVAAFTLASGLTGAAQTLSQIILFRILQGLGGGALQPVAQSILMESFPPEKRGQAMAFYGMGIVVAPILGPIMGGWLTDNYSWRWAFYINLPIGILALFLISRFIEDPPYLKRSSLASIDAIGFAFLALWVGALQIVLDKGQEDEWFDSRMIVGLTIVAVVFFVYFVGQELTTRIPVVNLGVLRDPTFALSTVLITMVGAVLYGTLTLTPLFLQTLLRYPAYNAGLAVAPRGMGAMVTMACVGVLLTFMDARYMVGVGFLLLGLSNFWLGHLNLQIGILEIALPNILAGVAMGLIFVPLTTISTTNISRDQMGQAAGIYNLMRNLGGSVGIAISTTLLSRASQLHQTYLAAHVNPYNPIFRSYPAVVRNSIPALYRMVQGQSSMLSYVDAYNTMGVLCWAAIPVVFLLRKPKKGKPEPGAMH